MSQPGVTPWRPARHSRARCECTDVAPEQERADHFEFDSRLGDLVRVPALIVGCDIIVEDVRQVLQVACSRLRLVLIGNHLQHTDDRYGRNSDA